MLEHLECDSSGLTTYKSQTIMLLIEHLECDSNGLTTYKSMNLR